MDAEEQRARLSADSPSTIVRVRSLPATPLFVGRERELERIRQAAQEVRLIVVYGVGGIGKTALIQRAAAQLSERCGARVAYVSCRNGEGASTAASAALAQLERRCPGIARPVEALMAEADVAPIALCLDDLQREVEPALIQALVHLATHQRSLWLFCASRETLPISPVDVDHVVVKLDALHPDEAAVLWKRLESLYDRPANAAPLDATPRTPLELKRRFAGTSVPTSAAAMGLESLPAIEARLLAQLCAFRREAPLSAVSTFGDSTNARSLIDRLVARFVVDWTGPDAVTVHDVVREAVAAASWAPGHTEHLRCLEYYRSLPSSQKVEPELLFHAVSAGEDAAALEMLVDQAQSGFGFPPRDTVADHDIAQAIDRLSSRKALPPTVRALRATIRARQGDTVSALQELKPLVTEGPIVGLHYGVLEATLGGISEAVSTLAPLVDDPALPLPARIAALAGLVGAHIDRDLADARRALERARPFLRALGPLGEGVRWWVEGILRYEHERYAAARAALQELRKVFDANQIPFRLPLAASLELLVLTASGARPREGLPGDLFDDVPFLRQMSRLLYARAQLLRGDARGAAALATEIAGERAYGFAELVHGAAQIAAEGLLMLGDLEAARSRLEGALAALATARNRDARIRIPLLATYARVFAAMGDQRRALDIARSAIPAAAETPGTRARLEAVVLLSSGRASAHGSAKPSGFDAAEWKLACAERFLMDGRLKPGELAAKAVEDAALAAGWGYLACRARVLRAEACLRRGKPELAAPLVDAARDAAEAAGYAREGEACAILYDALARARGEPVEPHAGELARRLGLHEAPTARVLDDAGRQIFAAASQLDEIDPTRYAFVADLVRRRVRVGKRWIDVARRGVLASFLCALGRCPGETVSVDRLTREIWNVEYHPTRHHSRVTTTVLRLRRLLGPASITGDSEGYRLTPPRPWIVIAPLSSG